MTRFLAALVVWIASLSAVAAGADGPVVKRIGVVGCHRQDQPAPALWRYVSADPDLMLWVGDNVYSDSPDDASVIVREHAVLAGLPAFQRLRESTPFAVTWDDHDYGLNDFGKRYAFKEESKRHFRRFWRVESLVPESQEGVYHSHSFGEGDERLQVLLLDGRFNRDDPGDTADTLGESQWEWLERELRKPATLRLIVNGYQFFLPSDSRFETWGKFPAAQRRLLALVRETGTEGVVFVAGDQHYGEVTRVPQAVGYDAIELMFCGINQEEPHVPNPWRVSPVSHAKNSYALIDIQWRETEADEPHLVFRTFDADRDAVELTYRVNFRELRRPEQRP